MNTQDTRGFVDVHRICPDVLLDMRYYSSLNFTGKPVPGYDAPIALLTREAAEALKGVCKELEPSPLRIKIYDAYRPQCAVDSFVAWADAPGQETMKSYFYPDLAKDTLFDLGFVAKRSGHSRGSTVDLTLFDLTSGRDLDMGSPFDFFGDISHYAPPGLASEQQQNRRFLRELMQRHGFRPYDGEWWHFTLNNEPYPKTYFTFPVAPL